VTEQVAYTAIVAGLFLVGPENVYVHGDPADEADSVRLANPSGVLPSGVPTVLPLGSVTQKLIAESVGSPEALTTKLSPTETELGLTHVAVAA